jgi:hypothetical protein
MYILLQKHKTKDWEKVEQEESEQDILVLQEEYQNSHDRSYMFKIEKVEA